MHLLAATGIRRPLERVHAQNVQEIHAGASLLFTGERQDLLEHEVLQLRQAVDAFELKVELGAGDGLRRGGQR